MLGILGQVGVLPGIFFHVKKFDSFVAVFTVLNVGPVALTEEKASSIGTKGGVAHFVLGVIEDWREVLALDSRRYFETTEF